MRLTIVFFTNLLLVNPFIHSGKCQNLKSFADSIRRQYQIPALGYAVVSSKGILQMDVSGVRKIHTQQKATLNDRFRIGSNTKAITGLIAALLVKQGKIRWNTRFFDLYPELKNQSKSAYYSLTLLDLLTFRTTLFPYTYTNEKPTLDHFQGNESEQRYQFAEWFFQQNPIKSNKKFNFSNLGYIAAGLMLERATGQSYKALVADLGKQWNIQFGFGNPISIDSLQPWGHDKNLQPDSNKESYKLNWLEAAGNINLSIPGYAQFLYYQLLGLQGKLAILSQSEFQFLHFGLEEFAVGWFVGKDENSGKFSYNMGNPGTFLSKVFVFPEADRAYIVLANAQTAAADEGIITLFEKLKEEYNSGKNLEK